MALPENRGRPTVKPLFRGRLNTLPPSQYRSVLRRARARWTTAEIARSLDMTNDEVLAVLASEPPQKKAPGPKPKSSARLDDVARLPRCGRCHLLGHVTAKCDLGPIDGAAERRSGWWW